MTKTHHKRGVHTRNVVMQSESGGKSKIILLLIELFVGAFGFDRMYMGCYQEGFAKLFLFMSIFALLPFSPVFAIVALFAWAAWALFDYVVVMFNALSCSTNTPFTFCRQNKWGSDGEVRNGWILAVIILVLHLSSYLSYEFLGR